MFALNDTQNCYLGVDVFIGTFMLNVGLLIYTFSAYDC